MRSSGTFYHAAIAAALGFVIDNEPNPTTINPQFLAARPFQVATYCPRSPNGQKQIVNMFSCRNWATASVRVDPATSFGCAAVETSVAG
jgi:hypothetical protein